MKKTILLSLTALSALYGSTIDEAFKDGDISGMIRGAYINSKHDAGGNDYGTTIGGIVKYETAAWNDLKMGVGAYVSQKIGFATGDNDHNNNELLNENGKSYAYLGEAYIDYSANDLTVRVGRQLIDTPFANTDDIRMHPNTFEAAIATYSGIEGTTLIGGYATRFAGYDSGENKSTFKRLGGEGSNGAVIAGAINESIDNLSLQGWYYGVDKLADLYYTDAIYSIPLSEDSGLELRMQYAHFDEKKDQIGNFTGIDGDVYGAGASFKVGMLTLGGAYNQGSNADGKSPTLGFGSGPYYTSMEEWTIRGMNDVKAYQLNAALDLGSAGLDGVTLTTQYGNFRSKTDNTKVSEFDIIAAVAFSESFIGTVSYATINDKNNNANSGADAGYDRFLVRLNYNF